jgi:DNA ligase 1
MDYSELVKAYLEIEKTTKRLEKTYVIADLLKKTSDSNIKEVILLLQGKVFPTWDERKTGISSQIALKAINMATGANLDSLKKEWAKKGDLGLVIEEIIKSKKQTALFPKKLTIQKVFENLTKLPELEGKGAISKKIQLVVELLASSTPKEAKFIIRTLTEELRIGVAQGTLRDSIAWAFYPRVENINDKGVKGKSKEIKDFEELKKLDFKKYHFIKTKDEKLARKIYNFFIDKVQDAFNLTNDFSEVALAIKKEKLSELDMNPGIPVNPMLAIKAETIPDALKSLGEKVLCEYKYDGFRLQIHKNKDEIKLFTRRLENVTKQFKEIVPLIEKHIKAKSCILDSELVGYDSKTNKYLPFQHISQRIRRKYNIEKKAKELPVEINLFDIMYKDGEVLISKTQEERRKILEKIIKPKEKKIILTKKLVTNNEKDIEKFYKESLKKGNEGIMIKSLSSVYKPGRYVGGWLKHKPIKETLDLVIVEADWGEGKRSKWLSSFTIACRDKNRFLKIGKVGTGIGEKDKELTFASLTEELKPTIKEQKGKHVILKPKIVLEISYEEIQKSPTYSSGYALRFPRVARLRPDRSASSIDKLERVEKFYKEQKK